MVLPIFGGIFLDRLGVRSGLIVFSAILTLGQLVFTAGAYYQNFQMMLVGRVIFGMGGESMQVAQSAIISMWFKGSELAFAVGINLSVGRLGSVLNSMIVPTLYDTYGLAPALFLGFLICIFSLFNAFGLAYIDKKAEDSNPNGGRAQISEEEKFKWSDIYSFSASYWLVTLSCLVTYMSIIPYLQNASDLLQLKYHFDKITAGYYFGIPNIISAIICPFLGYTIDKVGKRAILCCISSLILIVAFANSMESPECNRCKSELFSLAMVGVGASIYSAVIWASIPYVVKEAALGTAFGFTTAIQNTGLVVVPSLVGVIKDKTEKYDHGYYYTMALFVGINVLGFAINGLLYTIDMYQNNGTLDRVHIYDNQKES